MPNDLSQYGIDISKLSPEAIEALKRALEARTPQPPPPSATPPGPPAGAAPSGPGGPPVTPPGGAFPYPDTPGGGRLPPDIKLPPGADSPLSALGSGGGPSAQMTQPPSQPGVATPRQATPQGPPPVSSPPPSPAPESPNGEAPAGKDPVAMLDLLAEKGLVDDSGNLVMSVGRKKLNQLGLTAEERSYYNRLRAVEGDERRKEKKAKRAERRKMRQANRKKKTFSDISTGIDSALEDL